MQKMKAQTERVWQRKTGTTQTSDTQTLKKCYQLGAVSGAPVRWHLVAFCLPYTTE